MPDELPPKKPLDFDWEETPKLGKPVVPPVPPPVEILEVQDASEALPEAKPVPEVVPVVVPVVKPKRPVSPKFSPPEFPKSRTSTAAPPERPARKRQYFAMFVLLSMFVGAILAVLVLMYAFVAGFQHFAPNSNKAKAAPTTNTKAQDPPPKKRDAVKE